MSNIFYWDSKDRTNNKPGSVVGINPISFVKTTTYSDETDSGWLKVKLSNAKMAHLCAYTKVQYLKKEDGRTYFKILDGSFKGKTASLTTKNAQSYLVNDPPTVSEHGAVLEVSYSGAEVSVFSRVRGKLVQIAGRMSFNGNTVSVSLSTVDAVSLSELPAGTYDILVPDNAHTIDYTIDYKITYPELKCHQVWFPIHYGDNNRYVHVGAISEGCVTVLDVMSWNKVYDYLIRHRRSDSRYVGKLIVRRT